jgi:ABC-type phosphate/phosphonate transport system substrate-binding protein
MLRTALFFAMIAPFFGAASGPPNTEGLKVGLLKTMIRDAGPAKFEVLTANFRAVMREQTGLDGDLVTLETPEAMRRGLEDGRVQLGAFHGFEFARQRERSKELEPVMVTAPDPEAMTMILVVAKADPAKGVADLRGATLAATDADSPESQAFLERLCKEAGGNSGEWFPKRYESKSPEDALDDVADGQAAKATVSTRLAWKLFERRKPGRAARLRVLAESEPFPPAVVACVKGKLDPETLTKFRTGMATAHRSERGARLMGQIRIERFAAVPADFAQRMAAVVKSYPPG